MDKRQLWCAECKRWMDRDVIAAVNLSIKGRSRFERSQGAAGEAMRGNVETEPLILRVDAAKLSRRQPTFDGIVFNLGLDRTFLR